MDITFKCVTCMGEVAIDESMADQLITCPYPHCRCEIRVPPKINPVTPRIVPFVPPAPAPAQATCKYVFSNPITNSQGALIIISLVLVLLYLHSMDKVISAKKWEYMIAAVADGSFTKTMNALGDDGWELVSSRATAGGSDYNPTLRYEVILKRPRRD